MFKNCAFIIPTNTCNNVPTLNYSGRQVAIVAKASLSFLLSIAIFNDTGAQINPVISGNPTEHIIQLAFKPLR